MQDSVRVDTKTIKASDGEEQYTVLVIGDPCSKPEALMKTFVDPFTRVQSALNSPSAAPEVKCGASGKLVGAIYSDGGYPIIGRFFTDQASLDRGYTDASKMDGQCEARKKNGYNSGMGLIFHLVADISPIPVKSGIVGYSEATPQVIARRSMSTQLPLVALGFVSLTVAWVATSRLRRSRSPIETDGDMSLEETSA